MFDFKKYHKNIAFIENNKSISYKELDEIINHTNISLEKTFVILLCDNTFYSISWYLSLLAHKHAILLLDKDIKNDLLVSIINTYEPDFILSPDELKLDIIKNSEFNNGYFINKTKFEKSNLYEELALLLPTSGSTGSQKLVRQSYGNLSSNIDSIVEYLNIKQNDITITNLPMHYTYGLSIINTHLKSGACIVITNKSIMQKEFWQDFKNYKITSLSGIPYTYEMLEKLRFFSMDLPHLKVLTQAGGKLSTSLQEKYARYAQEKNIDFYVMYGQTEASPRISYLPSKYALSKIGSIGIPVSGGKIEIIDDELIYKGKNVALGYAYSKDDLSKKDEFNGILHTGDLCRVDEDGFYYITGRKSRFLKLFGNRVSLEEVEQIIKNNFNDLEVACVGKDDKMVVYITKDRINDIKNLLLSVLKIHFSAFDIKLINNIPRNSSGKIIYKDLEC